jgi:hypothetical protein
MALGLLYLLYCITHNPEERLAMKMYLKMVCMIVCIVLSSLAIVQTQAQQAGNTTLEAPTLTNELILELFEAGFSAETIIRRIKLSQCHFDTEPSQIAKLKNRGVPESVLRAMRDAGTKRERIDNDANPILVQVAEGTFIFQNLKLSDAYSQVTGEVLNNTGKNWDNLNFRLTGIDANGNRIENGYDLLNDLHIFNLKAGETKKISASLRGFDQRLPTRLEVKFLDGEYAAQYTVAMLKPKPSDELIFDDAFIHIGFAISKRQIGFLLRNKTDNPISIDWNQVSYIDLAGDSHKVMHEGVKYITRSEPQAPSVIPPTANLKDIVFPVDYVSYSTSRYSSGWREEPLFPEGPEAGKYKNGTFSVFLPIVINGTSRNYLFSFKIVNVEM